MKTYVVGTHLNHLDEMVQMNTHNICFHSKIRKIILQLSAIYSSYMIYWQVKQCPNKTYSLQIFKTVQPRDKIDFLKYAHFKGPVVNWWWFSTFLKAFQKFEKFEDFHDRGPARKMSFLGISHFLHISHPNQQICTFQGSCGQQVVIFIIFKGFPESLKIWRLSWPRTCEKNVIFGISHFCIFLTQISKYAHFKGPLVNWWWFSSFLKAFQKVKKFEDFHDRWPARKMSFWGISHFCIFLTQISKYAHFKGPAVNWWWFSSF